MIFETIRSEGLAHFSYLLGDEESGVCTVIDPRRDAQVYLDLARCLGARITCILETHIHADFVSGSCELAQCTGAPIYVGPGSDYAFEHRTLQDGDTIEIGALSLKVLHTPGHTPEHVCFVVSGGSGASQPWGLFSGDTLFAGEIGRPDLLGKGNEKQLAQQLFHTLQEKILPLGDDLIVYPAHGEGSPCGATIGARRHSTIGYERRNNPLLTIADREEFVQRALQALSPAPAYYPRMKRLNAQGPPLLGALPYLPPLTADVFQELMAKPHTVVVDAREIEAFAGAHIKGSINIALRKAFPIWAGRLLDPIFADPPSTTSLHSDSQILLILPDEHAVQRTQLDLLRIGYDNVRGYLHQGMRGWIDAGKQLSSLGVMSIHELRARIETGDDLQLLDVRSPQEWNEGHIPTATHIHVPDLIDKTDRLHREKPLAVYCGSGYRASMAASLLRRHGFKKVFNVPGSMTAWKSADYPLEQPS